MSQETTIDIKKFKEFVFSHYNPDQPIFKYIQLKSDAVSFEEAPYFAATCPNLIDQSRINDLAKILSTSWKST
ncbi:MAG: hypothetical protein PXY39_14450 [archaeon]|nr:hypothetical protein [archaeon]